MVGALMPGSEEGQARQVEAAQPWVEWMAQTEVGVRRAQPEVEERPPEVKVGMPGRRVVQQTLLVAGERAEVGVVEVAAEGV